MTHPSPPPVDPVVEGFTTIPTALLRQHLGHLPTDCWQTLLWWRNHQGITNASRDRLVAMVNNRRAKADLPLVSSQRQFRRALERLRAVKLLQWVGLTDRRGRGAPQPVMVRGSRRGGLVTIPEETKDLILALKPHGRPGDEASLSSIETPNEIVPKEILDMLDGPPIPLIDDRITTGKRSWDGLKNSLEIAPGVYEKHVRLAKKHAFLDEDLAQKRLDKFWKIRPLKNKRCPNFNKRCPNYYLKVSEVYISPHVFYSMISRHLDEFQNVLIIRDNYTDIIVSFPIGKETISAAMRRHGKYFLSDRNMTRKFNWKIALRLAKNYFWYRSSKNTFHYLWDIPNPWLDPGFRPRSGAPLVFAKNFTDREMVVRLLRLMRGLYEQLGFRLPHDPRLDPESLASYERLVRWCAWTRENELCPANVLGSRMDWWFSKPDSDRAPSLRWMCLEPEILERQLGPLSSVSLPREFHGNPDLRTWWSRVRDFESALMLEDENARLYSNRRRGRVTMTVFEAAARLLLIAEDHFPGGWVHNRNRARQRGLQDGLELGSMRQDWEWIWRIRRP